MPTSPWWLTASEIADLKISGIPWDRRQVSRLAAAKGWKYQTTSDGTPLARRRAGRSGGIEYHASLFPEKVQMVMVDRERWQRILPSRSAVRNAFQQLPHPERHRLLLDLLADELRG